MESETLPKGLIPCLRLVLVVGRNVRAFKARPARAENVRSAGGNTRYGRFERTERRVDANLRIQSSVFGR